MASRATPGPWSVTSTRSEPSATAALTRISDSGGEYLAAFSIRFDSTWSTSE